MKVERRIKKFDKQANMYDKKREKLELASYRKSLLGSARGHVLELGIGAGSNLPFYRSDVKLTAVDFSPAMLEKAKLANEAQYGLEAEYIQGDIDAISLEEDGFDTVVSTLSLCAYSDPGKVLTHISRWCKPEGQVLLLEHGISSNKFLAAALKVTDPLAYRIAGCHYNRDIMKLIVESPLEVIKAEHYMSGMLHLVWCKPGSAVLL